MESQTLSEESHCQVCLVTLNIWRLFKEPSSEDRCEWNGQCDQQINEKGRIQNFKFNIFPFLDSVIFRP